MKIKVVVLLVSLWFVPLFAFGQMMHYPTFFQQKPVPQYQGHYLDPLYNSGLTTYNQGLYHQAITIFRDVLSQCHYKCDLRDNAYYWIGMSYYNLKDYNQARQSFHNVIATGGNKVVDAQYMLTIASSSEFINNRMPIPVLTITPAQLALMTPAQIQKAKTDISFKIAEGYRKLANNLDPESKRAVATEIAKLYNESKILHGGIIQPLEELIVIIMTW